MRPILDASDPLNNDLMLFLPLTDRRIGDGAKVVDISPFRRIAANVNATTIAYGPMGPVYQGVDPNVLVTVSTRSYTNISDCGLGGLTARMSMALWVYRATTNTKGLFCSIGSPTDGFCLGIGSTTADSTGNNVIGLFNNIRWLATGFDFGTGWHHLAMTLNASGYPTIYYDGRQIYTDTTGAPAAIGSGGTAMVTLNSQVSTGTPTFSRFGSGRYSGFRVWRRTLNAAEVKRLAADAWAGTAVAPQWRYSTASPDVTTALTGTAATGAVGTLGVAVSTATSGTAATGATGTVTPAAATALAGTAATGAAGTLAPGASAALSGQAGTGASGSIGDGVATALTGLLGVGAVGTLGVSAPVDVALTGVEGIGYVGTITALVSGEARGSIRGRSRAWEDVWEDVPTELQPVVSLAEHYADVPHVDDVVTEQLARYARLSSRASLNKRMSLLEEVKRTITHVVAQAAEDDDEETLVALI